MMMRLLLFVLIWLNVLPIPAVAEGTDAALAAFEAGTEQFRAGEYSAAADSFRKANALRPNWKLYYNIGQSEAAAKRHGLALEAFETYLSKGGDDIPKERIEELEEEIDRLRKIVGYVQVAAPDGVVVYIDDIARGEAPLPGALMVAAGVVHQVRAGDLPSRTVKVAGQQTAAVNFQDQTAPMSVAEATSPSDIQASADGAAGRPEPGSRMRTAGFITLGLGAATLIGGAVTGGLALSANGDIKTRCPDGCYSEDYDLLDRGNHLALSTDVLIGVGSAAVVTGTILIILAGRRHETPPIEVQPDVSRTSGGLTVKWRF